MSKILTSPTHGAKKPPQGLPFILRQRARHAGYKVPSVSNRSNQLYICPLSNIAFSGPCPVTTCPGCHKTVAGSGCLYLFYGRTRLDRSDILFSYKLNDRQYQKALQQGQETTRDVVLFYQAINEVRNQDKTGHCPACGVRHAKGIYQCDNADTCQKRTSFANRFIAQSNLRFSEVKSSHQDVFRIAKAIGYFRTLAERQNTNIEQLLGVGGDQIKALEQCIHTV